VSALRCKVVQTLVGCQCLLLDVK